MMAATVFEMPLKNPSMTASDTEQPALAIANGSNMSTATIERR